jgi:hypothetical protein
MTASQRKSTAMPSLLIPAAFLLLVSALFLPALAMAQSDEDLFAAGAGVPPNVLLSFDTSGSMNIWVTPSFAVKAERDDDCRPASIVIAETSPGFVQTGTYTCEGAQGGTAKIGYVPVSGGATCGNRTRNIWVDPVARCAWKSPDSHSTSTGGIVYQSWPWHWYFSAASDAHYIGDVNNSSTDENMLDATRNYYDGYSGQYFPKHAMSRMTTNRRVARELMFKFNSDCAPGTGATCTQFTDKVRFGIGRFMQNHHGGYVSIGIDDYSSNRTLMNNHLFGMISRGNTPLSESLFRIYTYFMSRSTSNLPKGKDNSTAFPVYQYRKVKSPNWNGFDRTRLLSASHADVAPQPDISQPCQKNFVIVFSDGAPSHDTFDNTGTDAEGFSDFQNRLIGDYYMPGDEVEELTGTNPGSRYLDDIAYFMNTKDFAPNVTGDQTIDVYTVGLNLNNAADTLMQNTADRGNGTYYDTSNIDELTDGLTDAFNDIIEKSSQSFSSASVPASRTSEGDSFYSTYFEPNETEPLWAGHLKAFEINGAGDLLDADGYCLNASVGNDPPPCAATGTLRRDVAPYFWDAAEEIPAPASRNLYYGKDIVPYQRPPAFTAANLDETELTLASSDLTPTPHNLASSLGQLADYIVDFFRGCVFGTSCTARGTLLGDIFHLDPVVVGPPNSAINEASYSTFATNHRTRDRVLYAGANDGFLHAFHAGDWDTSLDPDRYNRGTGTELFGFMPWTTVNQMKKRRPIRPCPTTFTGRTGR